MITNLNMIKPFSLSNIWNKKKNRDAMTILKEFNKLGRSGSNTKYNPYHLIFVLDHSGSMTSTDGTNKTRWQKLFESFQGYIENYINSGQTNHVVSVIIYHNSSTIVTE